MSTTTDKIRSWGDFHSERLQLASDAVARRTHYAPFQESPRREHHRPGAKDAGAKAFEDQLGRPFTLQGPATDNTLGEEVSPYTGERLGVTYAAPDADALMEAAAEAIPSLGKLKPSERIAICLEILQRWDRIAFEMTYATMHTTGQPFLLAFAGSGASSLERGLEAVVHANNAMQMVPSASMFEREFGGESVSIFKRFRVRPRGVGVVIACGSYPNWNAYPAILANLATGNPTVVKPSPRATLPMAIAIREAQTVLVEAGVDPQALLLAPDTNEAPLAKSLANHRHARLVDFTGSQAFGAWLEKNARAHAQNVYTETSGCNAVLVDSVYDLDQTLRVLAQGFAFFSGQMCTAPQNLYVPKTGIKVRSSGEILDADVFLSRLASNIDALANDPRAAAATFGAIQNPSVVDAVGRLAQTATSTGGKVIREARPYAHPEFERARTLTPLMLELPADHEMMTREQFGPVILATKVEDRDEALRLATEQARTSGSIANYVYSSSDAFALKVEDAFADAGASVGINLLRQVPIHYSAAFSDYHVTGLNPAGNACLTDVAFVASRFRIVQAKTEIVPPEAWQAPGANETKTDD